MINQIYSLLRTAVVAALLFSFHYSFAQISITQFETPYSQNFDALSSSGNSSVVPSGWSLLETGSNSDSSYGISDGSQSHSNTYSYGVSGDADRAFGTLRSNNQLESKVGAWFTNNTGTTVNTIVISYYGELWKYGGASTVDRLDFQYSLNATGLNFSGWMDVNELDFHRPSISGSAGARNGNLAENRTLVTHTLNNLNIANGNKIFIRWTDLKIAGNEDGLAIDDFSITFLNVTTWTGSPAAWDKGFPNEFTRAVIAVPYSGTGADAAFTTNHLTVNQGQTLVVNHAVTTFGSVTNKGNIIVEDGANFIQKTGSVYAGETGSTFKVNKNVTNATTLTNKYTFWSSPVQNQNIYGFYTTGAPQYVMTYNSNTDGYNTVGTSTTGAQGIGYSVKYPSANPTTASFVGTPNNGDVQLNLDNTPNANGNTYNLIGNPYPSNLDLVALYKNGNNGIASTIYFWDNITAQNVSQLQNATTWGIFNGKGSGTWSKSGLPTTVSNVEPGQGFIVKATGPIITFTNAMRNAVPATFVNKNTNTANEGKYWLQLITPAGLDFSTAVTYGEGAQNIFEDFDSRMMSVGTNSIYSFGDNNKYGIQGRDYFVNTDVVTLGNKHSAAGQYTIALSGKTGIFANGQAIYLKDKELGIYTDLHQGSYTFTTGALEQQNRFEIVYLQQNSLGTSELVKEELGVFKKDGAFEVLSAERIMSIEIFDASGRLVKTLAPNARKATIHLETKGMYVLKVKTEKSEYVQKILN